LSGARLQFVERLREQHHLPAVDTVEVVAELKDAIGRHPGGPIA